MKTPLIYIIILLTISIALVIYLTEKGVPYFIAYMTCGIIGIIAVKLKILKLEDFGFKK